MLATTLWASAEVSFSAGPRAASASARSGWPSVGSPRAACVSICCAGGSAWISGAVAGALPDITPRPIATILFAGYATHFPAEQSRNFECSRCQSFETPEALCYRLLHVPIPNTDEPITFGAIGSKVIGSMRSPGTAANPWADDVPSGAASGTAPPGTDGGPAADAATI